jgi:DNA-binding NarL/FixJ family response regulator
MNKNIRIILADDHLIILRSISTLLNQIPDIEVVALAENGERALTLARSIPADIMILDIDMPKMNGLQVTAQLKSLDIDIKVVIFTIYDDPSIVRSAIEKGASGYVLKNRAMTDLQQAIRMVNKGKRFLSEPIATYDS